MSEAIKINFNKLKDWVWLIVFVMGGLFWSVQEFTLLKMEIRNQKEQIKRIEVKLDKAYSKSLEASALLAEIAKKKG